MWCWVTIIPLLLLKRYDHHGKAVVRGSKRAFLIIDMPFLTYQINSEDALRNAGRIIQETGAQGLKLEGEWKIAEL